MKYFVTSTLAIALLLFTIGCGSGKKEKEGILGEKKAALEKLRTTHSKTEEQIKTLEKEIAALDTASANIQVAKLVAVQTVSPTPFEHYVELQGRIDAEDISFVTPRGMGGVVKNIYVKQGEYVKKGQLLMKLDNAVMRQNVVAAREALSALKTQLDYASNIYQRQKNLWEENIGTEVQLITAKNNVAALEHQIKISEANVRMAMEQLNMTNVYSEVSGIADNVNIKVGETFSPSSASMLGIRIVNTASLKVISNIPENYVSRIAKGTLVIVNVPDLGRIFNSSVSFIGASIDVANRGFNVEARLPHDPSLKPNQIAMVKIRDYNNADAMVVPVNTLQNDEKGKFVLVASKENGKLIARKRIVNIGMLNGNALEIKTGLQPGDILITEGFQSLYDGASITTQ